MEINDNHPPPDDFFKGIKTSLKSVFLKHPDINTPKITNV